MTSKFTIVSKHHLTTLPWIINPPMHQGMYNCYLYELPLELHTELSIHKYQHIATIVHKINKASLKF